MPTVDNKCCFLSTDEGYFSTIEGKLVATEFVSKSLQVAIVTLFKTSMLILLSTYKIYFCYLLQCLRFICQIIAIIGVLVNIFWGGLPAILLWIAFCGTIAISGATFICAICGSYPSLLEKYPILITVVRKHNCLCYQYFY